MPRRDSLLLKLHGALLEEYGPQGWWPLLSSAGRRGFDACGYHPGRYDLPRTEAQRFEVILGALLTQNTSWANAAQALRALQEEGLLDERALGSLGLGEIARRIRSSRYFRQKARKILAVLAWRRAQEEPTREGLLRIWGIGPETADSILLYAYGEPIFVVDAYTRRILAAARLIPESGAVPYDEVQALFHRALPRDAALFNEYHALLVEHGKRHYSRRPYGAGDRLLPALRRRPRR